MSLKSSLSVLLPVLVAGWSLPGAVYAAAVKVVVFDIEPAQMPHTPETDAKLVTQSNLLRKLMSDKGYAIVDTKPQAKKIADNLPLSECNGCDGDIAKALGADLEVATGMQQLSAASFTLSGSITDVKTGRVLRHGVVNVQGEDPDTWAHGIKYLVRERLLAPPLPNDEKDLDAMIQAGSAPPAPGRAR